MLENENPYYLAEDTVVNLLKDISSTTPGTKERSNAVNDAVNFINAYNDMNRVDIEANEVNDKIDHRPQWNSELALTCIKIGGELVVALVPAILYRVCFKDGIKFENDGFFSTKMQQSLIGKLSPKK